jgi:DNA-binding FadR family transcriptional regulator
MSYVRENRLTAGAKLPSERELAVQLKVSRHIIREAYLALSARGMVVIEHGRGVFLVASTDDIRPHSLIMNTTDMKNIINLLEVRQLIECGAIPLAMERATPEDYKRLKELIAADDGRLYLHDNIFIPSVTFESEIINLTGNPSLINVERNVMDAWKNLWVRLKLSTLKPLARTMEHYEILEAMEKGDIKLAQKSLHAHLSSILLVIDHAAH